MLRFKFGLAVIVLAAALSTAAYAANKGGGAEAVAAATAAVVAGMLPEVADTAGVAVAAIPVAAAAHISAAEARVTSAPDRRYPGRLRSQVPAAIELLPTLLRTMRLAKERLSIQPGTQRATRT